MKKNRKLPAAHRIAQLKAIRTSKTKINAGAGWHERKYRDPRKEYDKEFLETYDDEWNPMHA